MSPSPDERDYLALLREAMDSVRTTPGTRAPSLASIRSEAAAARLNLLRRVSAITAVPSSMAASHREVMRLLSEPPSDTPVLSDNWKAVLVTVGFPVEAMRGPVDTMSAGSGAWLGQPRPQQPFDLAAILRGLQFPYRDAWNDNP